MVLGYSDRPPNEVLKELGYTDPKALRALRLVEDIKEFAHGLEASGALYLEQMVDELYDILKNSTE